MDWALNLFLNGNKIFIFDHFLIYFIPFLYFLSGRTSSQNWVDIILQNMIGSNLEIDRFHNLFTKVRQISFIESDSIFYFHKFLLMNFLDLTLNIYEMQMQPQRQQKEAIQLYLIYLLLHFFIYFIFPSIIISWYLST